MLNQFVKRIFSKMIGPISTEKRFGAKYACTLYGHVWNEFSIRSSYRNKYCTRCKKELAK